MWIGHWLAQTKCRTGKWPIFCKRIRLFSEILSLMIYGGLILYVLLHVGCRGMDFYSVFQIRGSLFYSQKHFQHDAEGGCAVSLSRVIYISL